MSSYYSRVLVLGLFLCVCLGLAFCVFFSVFILDYFVLVLFAFVVLGLVSSVLCAKRLAGKNVSKMTYFVSSGMQNLKLINQ